MVYVFLIVIAVLLFMLVNVTGKLCMSVDGNTAQSARHGAKLILLQDSVRNIARGLSLMNEAQDIEYRNIMRLTIASHDDLKLSLQDEVDHLDGLVRDAHSDLVQGTIITHDGLSLLLDMAETAHGKMLDLSYDVFRTPEQVAGILTSRRNVTSKK